MSLERVHRLKLLNLLQVLARVNVSRSALYKWMANGTFPKKVKMGSRTAWVEAEVDAWIVQRIEAGRDIKRGEG
jgi:prophage regulatory protein